MKILLVNKFFYLHGGVERYFFKLARLLESKKHQVAFFSMVDKDNFKSPWSKYFVSHISFTKTNFQNSIKILGRMFYSLESREKISALLDDYIPALVHLRTIYHHISPSILPEFKKRNIPVVQTLGDYHLIAPNYNLFHDEQICEITKKKSYYKAIFHKCVKNSYLVSLAETIEKYVHDYLGLYRRNVDFFISPSKFMKNKLIEYGIGRDKIIHLPHFVDYSEYKPDYGSGDYILYFGRLREEKGLRILLKAMKSLSKVKLKIIGRGIYRDTLEKLIDKLNLKNVTIIESQESAKLKESIYKCRFTLLPSIWYENFPNSILEAFVSGKPVIGSNIGGIPELIKHNYNGLLANPGNVEDLVEKISNLWNDRKKVAKMGKNAREYVEENFAPDIHYQKLMDIYKRAAALHRK